MKKILTFGLPVMVVVAGLAFMGIQSLKEDKPVKEKEKMCCAKELGKGEVSENSIYNSDSKWVDQNNRPVQLTQFEGKPVVLTMFFASCTYACPILVNDMKKIEAGIPKDKLNNYSFVLVSIDPERDTPENLRKLAEKRGLDLKRWTLLSGSSENVMELAAMIGFKYKKEPTGEYSHSNLITLLNEDGEIVHQQVGLNAEPGETINEIVKL